MAVLGGTVAVSVAGHATLRVMVPGRILPRALQLLWFLSHPPPSVLNRTLSVAVFSLILTAFVLVLMVTFVPMDPFY